MKRPSFQFYPGDWRANANLRRCSPAARGAWVDVLCVLHDSDEYGVCRWPLADLANASGVPLKLAQELVSKDVLKGSDKDAKPYIYTPRHAGKDGDPVTLVEPLDGPCWYSSRFVRDEYVRLRRGDGTRFGSDNQPEKRAISKPKTSSIQTERAKLRAAVLNKTGGFCHHCKRQLSDPWEIDHFIPRAKGGTNLFSNLVPACVSCNQDKYDSLPEDWSPPTDSPTRPIGVRQGDGSSSPSSSASSSSNKTPKGAPAGFDEFWSAYPRKDAKPNAMKAFAKVTAPLETLLSAIAKQKTSEGWTKEGGKYIPMPASWLNAERWNDGVVVVDSSDDAETKAGIEKQAYQKGIAAWNPIEEQWPAYRERVLRAPRLPGMSLDQLMAMAPNKQGATA